MIDWKRVIRTAIQVGCGAGVSLITAIAANYSKEAVIAAVTEFVVAVLTAVLMNIEKQVGNEKEE